MSKKKPTAPKTPAAPPASGSQSTATFNDQMYLMDLYAQNPNDGAIFPGNITSNAKVPDLGHDAKSMNEYLQKTQQDKLFKWIQDVTPEEYAQLSPVVQLDAVNAATNEVQPIPLSENSKLHQDGLSKQTYWYTNKTVGLKSMTMELDGNTNPVGGKIYKITLNILFDSMNTFFNSIGGGAPAYSKFLQSQSPAGSSDAQWYLKLSVFYDGPSDIIAKYGLQLPHVTFSSYLNLIKSELQLKENLQAECKCVFQGWQESLFQNNALFDWLRLDLQKAADELRAQIATEREKSRSDIDALTAKHTRNMQTYASNGGLGVLRQAKIAAGFGKEQQKFAKQRSRWEKRGIGRSANNVIDITNNRVISQIQRERDILKQSLQIQHAAGVTSTFESLGINPADLNKPVSDWTPAQRSAWVNHTEFLSDKSNEAVAKKAIDLSLSGKDGGNRLGEVFGDNVKAKSLTAARHSADTRKHAIDSFNTNKKERTQALNSRIRELEAGFAQLRAQQIDLALQDAIFAKVIGSVTLPTILGGPRTFTSPREFHKIEVTSQQVQNYIDQMSSSKAKDFLDPKTLAPTSEQRPTTKSPPESAGGASASAANQRKLDELNQKIRNAEGVLRERQGLRKQLPEIYSRRSARFKNAVIGDQAGKPISQKTKKIKREMDMAQRQLQSLDGEASNPESIKNASHELKRLRAQREKLTQQTTVSLGTKKSIEDKLSNFKIIEFIYLGDLISLLLDRIERQSTKSPVQKNQIDKTRFILTVIKLQVSNLTGSASSWRNLSLYKFPISIYQLKKLLSDRLYGNSKNSLTIFETFKDIAKLIALSQERKNRLLNQTSRVFSVNFFPAAMIGEGSNLKLASSRNDDAAKIKNVIITVPRDSTAPTLPNVPAIATNRAHGIAHFNIGGMDKGILRSMDLKQIQGSDESKVAFERNKGTGASGMLTAIYKVNLKLLGTPSFHLGTYFYIDTSGLNISSTSGRWFFLKGYYSANSIKHSYTINGGYVTEVEGTIASHSGLQSINTLSARKANRNMN